MTPCLVCGRPGAPMACVRPVFHDDHDIRRTRIEWVPAPSPGASCSPECGTLIRVRSERTPDEQKLTAWRWRQRWHEVRGLEFTEPQPMTNLERKLTVLLSLRGEAHPKSEVAP